MSRLGWALAALVLLLSVLTAPLLFSPAAPVPDTAPTPSPAPAVTAAPAARDRPYRAVWVSYLEWQQVDFSSADAFSRDIAAMLDNIAAVGATVVLAQVRPFGMPCIQAATSPSATSAPAPRARTPASTRWLCWSRPPTPGTWNWKPGSTLTASRRGACRPSATRAPP